MLPHPSRCLGAEPYVLMGYSSRGVTAITVLWTAALVSKDHTEAEAKHVSGQEMVSEL